MKIFHKMKISHKNENLSLFMQINPPPTRPPPFCRDFRAGGKAGGPHRRIASPIRKCLRSGRAGVLTLCVFLLTSCCVYPTWLGRARMERKLQQQQHDSVVQGPRAIIAPRAVRLILSGIPLSLIYRIYTPDISLIYHRATLKG